MLTCMQLGSNGLTPLCGSELSSTIQNITVNCFICTVHVTDCMYILIFTFANTDMISLHEPIG